VDIVGPNEGTVVRDGAPPSMEEAWSL
jgi:hypothetical protein